MAKTQIVLVDKNDKVIGYKEKFAAHKNPVPLHRAISVVVFSPDRKKILLQKRAKDKPTWPLFWSNTACSHPFKNENYVDAATRRLREEMGFTVPLNALFKFIYKAEYDKNWGEHEHDVVFEGVYDGVIIPNAKEVDEYKWMDISDLKRDLIKNPHLYTPWFKIILERML